MFVVDYWYCSFCGYFIRFMKNAGKILTSIVFCFTIEVDGYQLLAILEISMLVFNRFLGELPLSKTNKEMHNFTMAIIYKNWGSSFFYYFLMRKGLDMINYMQLYIDMKIIANKKKGGFHNFWMNRLHECFTESLFK